MNSKIFVGGLDWNVDDTGLAEAFEPFGEIKHVKVITDHETGRSRGFGFVTFQDRDSMHKAIDGMHDKELLGRPLRVNEAEDRRRA